MSRRTIRRVLSVSQDRAHFRREYFRRGNNGEFAEHNGRAHNRFAEGNHDFDHHHGNGHRVFRNGVWVWAYGPDYYAYGDCGWLLRRAEVTGSPYWWSRYDALWL